jgi:hypothetical protein
MTTLLWWLAILSVTAGWFSWGCRERRRPGIDDEW